MNRRKVLRMFLTGLAAAALPVYKRSARAEESDFEVIIIGAGISGLTAGFILSDRNIVVLEAEEQIGGRALSGQHGGWSYSKGTEYLGRPEGALEEIIDTLGLELVEIPSPMDRMHRQGKYYSGFAGKAKLLTSEGGYRAYNNFLRKLRSIEKDYTNVPEYRPGGPLERLDTITIRTWFDEMGLPEIYYQVYNVMARGLFGANIDEVSALGGFEEIAFDFEGAERIEDWSDLRELRREKQSSDSYTFLTGIAEVPRAIAESLGDKVKTGSRVTNIEGDDDEGYTVTFIDSAGKELEISSDAVIIATPAPITVEIAGDVLTEEQTGILKQIPYAPYVTAALFTDKPLFDEAFDLALLDGWFFTDFYDSTWVQRKLDKKASAYKGAISSLYIGADTYKDASILSMSDEELLKRCFADLHKIIPDAESRVKGYDIHRHKYAYPVSTPGAFARLTRLHQSLNSGLQLAGDGVIYPTFQTAIMIGEAAAERINEYL